MARPQSSASKIIILLLLAVLGAIAYALAPMFLPVYRWMNVDFAKIAREATARGIPTSAALVAKPFEVEFAYVERGPDDPRPWVLLSMNPTWAEATGDVEDEAGLALRCTVIGDRTGKPISGFLLGSHNYKDRFFKAKVWRLPPGSLGLDKERPIILFDAMTLEKMDIGRAEELNYQLKNHLVWTQDEDGYTPGGGE